METTQEDERCPEHPHQTLIHCAHCHSDILASGDPKAVAAWKARIREAECNKLFPPRFRQSRVDHAEVEAWVKTWNESDTECPSLLLAGAVGVGKTWQAYGALRAAVTGPRPTSWMAVTSADLYASLRPQQGNDSEAQLEKYRRVGLLLIDDLGAAKPSEWVEEITYRVLNGRYEAMRPCIFTTNLAVPALRDAIGDRIASRLAETCTRVVLEGNDRRRTGQTAPRSLRPSEPDPESERAAERRRPAVDIWS